MPRHEHMVHWGGEGGRGETALKLWDDGLSATQIACVIGDVSRNAVCGFLHRAGAMRSEKKRTERPRAIRAAFIGGGKALPREVIPPVSERRAAAERDLPATDDLTSPHGCRWPIGDPKDIGTEKFRYCQREKVKGSSYCDVHHEASYDGKPKVNAFVPGSRGAGRTGSWV